MSKDSQSNTENYSEMRTCLSAHTQSHTYNSTKKTLKEKIPVDVDLGWVYKHAKEHVQIPSHLAEMLARLLVPSSVPKMGIHLQVRNGHIMFSKKPPKKTYICPYSLLFLGPLQRERQGDRLLDRRVFPPRIPRHRPLFPRARAQSRHHRLHRRRRRDR